MSRFRSDRSLVLSSTVAAILGRYPISSYAFMREPNLVRQVVADGASRFCIRMSEESLPHFLSTTRNRSRRSASDLFQIWSNRIACALS